MMSSNSMRKGNPQYWEDLKNFGDKPDAPEYWEDLKSFGAKPETPEYWEDLGHLWRFQ